VDVPGVNFRWLREWMRLKQDDMGGLVLVGEAGK